jgi:hypothetical protein
MRRITILALTLSLLAIPVSAGAVDTTLSEHVRLGFAAELPISETISDDCCLGTGEYTVGFSGDASLVVDMGADVALTYDPADLLDGGSMPLAIGYTPTNDDGPELSLDVSGDFSFDFCLLAVICDGDTASDVTFVAGTGDFTAPLAGDPAVNIPLSSDTLEFFVGPFKVADAHIEGPRPGPVAGRCHGLGRRPGSPSAARVR